MLQVPAPAPKVARATSPVVAPAQAPAVAPVPPKTPARAAEPAPAPVPSSVAATAAKAAVPSTPPSAVAPSSALAAVSPEPAAPLAAASPPGEHSVQRLFLMPVFVTLQLCCEMLEVCTPASVEFNGCFPCLLLVLSSAVSCEICEQGGLPL